MIKYDFGSICRRFSALRSRAGFLLLSALVLTIVIQHQVIGNQADKLEGESDRIRSLRSELLMTKIKLNAYERMRGFLGDDGFCVLRSATHVELLRVERGKDFPRRPAGVDVEKTVIGKLGEILSNEENYSDLDSDDLPEPQFGFRFRNGHSMFDILVSVNGNETSRHTDLFVFSHDNLGNEKYHGQKCMYSKALHQLLVPFVPQRDR